MLLSIENLRSRQDGGVIDVFVNLPDGVDPQTRLDLLAYVGVWMLVGAALMVGVVATHAVDAALGVPMGLTGLAVALLWQSSPAKQYCLNRCHWLPRLSPFGWPADRDCIRFGITHALWCSATCWVLMLAALAASGVHLLAMAMAIASVVMIAERLRPSRPARWRLPSLVNLRA